MSDKIEYDVLLVGGSLSNLTLAYRLVELTDSPIRIALIEKGIQIGNHLISGALSNPRVIKKMFPDWDKGEFPLEGICSESYLSVAGVKGWEDVPAHLTPPYFKKEGYAILSISEVAKYMAAKIKEKADAKTGVVVDIYPGFAGREIIYDGPRVAGVRIDSTGTPSQDVCYAKVVVFGDKGFLSRDLIQKFNLRKHGQTYAVGVKEIWEVNDNYEGKVWHTVGYPLAPGHIGGGFIYGCKNSKVIIGEVMGLDFANPNIRPQQVLQDFKKHPFIQKMIKGGKLLKYGASVLPEGGYYSLPESFAVDGAMMVGDALGTLDVRRFSGVDKAMESGYIAAEVIASALAKNDTSASTLNTFKSKFMDSWVGKELHDSRYFRHTFQKYPGILNFFVPGVIKKIDAGKELKSAGFSTILTNPFASLRLLGAKKMIERPSDRGPVNYPEDRSYIKPSYNDTNQARPSGFDPATVYSTADVVFYAHTYYGEDSEHIDEFNKETCLNCIKQYDAVKKDTPCVGDCTANVHQTQEKDGRRYHAMDIENCVQCRTCEIVCPYRNLRVNAAPYGYGPDFTGL